MSGKDAELTSGVTTGDSTSAISGTPGTSHSNKRRRFSQKEDKKNDIIAAMFTEIGLFGAQVFIVKRDIE